jgi:hypothetical protein
MAAIEARKLARKTQVPGTIAAPPDFIVTNHSGDLQMLPLYAALGALASATVV